MRIFIIIFFSSVGFISCKQKLKRSSQKEEVSDYSNVKQFDSILPTTIECNSLIDLGDLSNIDTAFAVFWLKNKGDNPLYIVEISPSCGCTKATEAPSIETPIAVRDSFKIAIGIDMSRINYGNFEKTVTVLSNSQDRILLLRIIGNKK
jgi:hypothetical protein